MGIDTNGKNNTILNSDAVAVDSLQIAGRDIENLSGIEAFTALAYLNCVVNQLTGLDVSTNTALTYLNCSSNSLTILNVSANTALTYLDCSDNRLTSLNINNGANGMLAEFSASSNPDLTCIQVDDASNIPSAWRKDTTAMYSTNCTTTPIPDDNFEQALIDLGIDTNDKNNNILNSDAVAVGTLQIAGRGIENLSGIEAFTALTYLNCVVNQLTSLDVSTNTALTYLDCSDNRLTSLNINNGANGMLATFNATNNPNLTCVQVDDASYPSAWRKDATASYSENCTTALSNEDFEKAGFTISPNPTNGILNITTTEKADYRLLNIRGQILKRGVLATGKSKIDISLLSKGIYFLNIKNGKGSFTKKAVKN